MAGDWLDVEDVARLDEGLGPAASPARPFNRNGASPTVRHRRAGLSRSGLKTTRMAELLMLSDPREPYGSYRHRTEYPPERRPDPD